MPVEPVLRRHRQSVARHAARPLGRHRGGDLVGPRPAACRLVPASLTEGHQRQPGIPIRYRPRSSEARPLPQPSPWPATVSPDVTGSLERAIPSETSFTLRSCHQRRRTALTPWRPSAPLGDGVHEPKRAGDLHMEASSTKDVCELAGRPGPLHDEEAPVMDVAGLDLRLGISTGRFCNEYGPAGTKCVVL